MKKKKQILLTCVISISILILIFYFLSKSSKEKTYTIFLLNQDLQSGCRVEKTMINPISIPQSCILPEICTKIEEIEGEYLNRDMKNGELLSLHDLKSSQAGVIYPSITQGKVLYTLALKAEDANGWWIAEGNEIILYIYDANEQNKINDTDASNEVIDSGTQSGTIEDSTSQEGIRTDHSIQIIESAKIVRIMDETGSEIIEEGKKPEMICLELSEEQAQLLFKAENGKKIKLIAKNPIE